MRIDAPNPSLLDSLVVCSYLAMLEGEGYSYL